jgi:competence protein ComEC
LEENISKLLPEPAAGLLSGILFGSKADISTELLSILTITGTMHIIALSGYNITVVAEGLRNFFKYSNRKISFWAPVIGIITFVLSTGG